MLFAVVVATILSPTITPIARAAGRSEDMLNHNAIAPFWGRDELTFEPTIDRIFARALDVPVWSGGANVRELEDRAEITMELPGVKPDQVQVMAEHRTLTVTTTVEGRQSMSRQYMVGSKYDIGKVQAKLELGVLTLTLPKAKHAQPRKIEIG
jgi:HSP20 family protein